MTPAATLAPFSRWSRWPLAVHPTSVRRLLWALPVVVIISVYYAFMASAGTFHDVPGQLDYYDQMCEGFRHGHLYIQRLPSPVLLAKPDPLAAANVRLGMWDACLYKAHYYLYWGPVPALMMLAFKWLMSSHERITDQWPTTLFVIGRLCAGAALILSLASRVRIRQPVWISTLAVAVFGLANPWPFIVARPHVYEASLAGGQCFLFWGLVWAFWGLEKPAFRNWFFALAGLAWALAIGCRVTMLVAVPFVMTISAGFAWYQSRSFKAVLYNCVALGVPVALAICAYGAYNYLRFDSATEFGIRYMVTLQPFNGKPEYVMPNIFSYLFGPVRWSCRFPFVTILAYRPLSTLIHWPGGYQSFERVGGIMITATWCWLVLLALLRVGAYLGARLRATSRPWSSNLSSHEAWALLCSVAVILSMVPVITLWEASMRYVGDATGGIVLLATLGVFWLLQRTYRARRRALGLLARGVVLALGIQTCVVGAFAAVTTYDDPLKYYNPTLYQQLDDSLSLCRTSP